jgi:uncharacterized membrane protein (DUF2068 family)
LRKGLLIIAIFKLTKAALLLALAIGAISLLHKDVAEVLTYRIGELGVSPEHRYMKRLIALAGFATPRRVALVSIGSFFYAALFATEGIGLLLHQRWAEYFTTIATASFLPLEFYELSQHPTIFKILVIIANIAIVVFLIWQLTKSKP